MLPLCLGNDVVFHALDVLQHVVLLLAQLVRAEFEVSFAKVRCNLWVRLFEAICHHLRPLEMWGNVQRVVLRGLFQALAEMPFELHWSMGCLIWCLFHKWELPWHVLKHSVHGITSSFDLLQSFSGCLNGVSNLDSDAALASFHVDDLRSGHDPRFSAYLEDSVTSSNGERMKVNSGKWEPCWRSSPSNVVTCLESEQKAVLGLVMNNPHNLCYINATLRAWLWVMCGLSSSEYFGQAESLACYLRSCSRPILVTDTPGFHALVCQWPGLSEQHDAAEFVAFMLRRCMPSKFCNVVGSMFENRDLSWCPVYVPMPANGRSVSLHSLLEAWSEEGNVGIRPGQSHIALRIARFCDEGGQWVKHHSHLELGRQVMVPVLHPTHGAMKQQFEVRAVVEHWGEELQAGHYTCHLWSGRSWSECDDGRPAICCHNLSETVCSNIYLVWLVDASLLVFPRDKHGL